MIQRNNKTLMASALGNMAMREDSGMQKRTQQKARNAKKGWIYNRLGDRWLHLIKLLRR